MRTTTTQVADIIAQFSDVVGRWAAQENAPGIEPSIKDRDINSGLRSLKTLREQANPAEVAEIDRLVDAAEALLNSSDRRWGQFPKTT